MLSILWDLILGAALILITMGMAVACLALIVGAINSKIDGR